ncbi:hypothetical protein G6014_11010, partial [Dietzia kunjamensis]|nr:hypothetical protein [Dietzia kunjamensis]
MARAAAALIAGSLLASLSGCALWSGGGDDTDEPTREQPGPTLAAGPPPADWQDVRSPTGLVYSVPPGWEVGDPFGVDDDAGDPGSDWGSGYVTTANAIADRGYCRLGG